MLHTLWLIIYRICALGAILFSSLLYVHYLNPVDSGFCAPGGGCEAVRASGFSYFGSRFINIPLIGIVAYAALLAASLFPEQSAPRRFLHWPSVFGGAVALGLVVAQALIVGAFCWMCLVVDVLAVALAFCSLAMLRAGSGVQKQALQRWAWSALLICSVGLPLLWNWIKPLPPVPAEIRALYQPGKINVVEFADFECPYCRRFHPHLKAVMKEYGDRVHFIRKHMPLAQHRFAEHAARGAICAEQQGQGEAMADALFEHDLRQDVAFDLAQDMGLDVATFRTCMRAEATDERLAEDQALLEAAGFQGLPTTYVGNRLIVGLRERAVLREAFDQAATEEQAGSVPAPLYLALSCLLGLGIAVAGRTRNPTPAA